MNYCVILCAYVDVDSDERDLKKADMVGREWILSGKNFLLSSQAFSIKKC